MASELELKMLARLRAHEILIQHLLWLALGKDANELRVLRLDKTPAWTPADFPISIQKCRVVCPTRPKRLSPRYFRKWCAARKINCRDRHCKSQSLNSVSFSSTRAAGTC